MTECDSKSNRELAGIILELKAHVNELEYLVEAKEEARRELRRSDRRSRAWLNNSPMCTKVIGKDLKLRFMSQAGVRDLRLDNISEYYGQTYPLDFFPEDFRTSMTASMKRALTTGEVSTLDSSVVDAEGNTLWFHSTIVPVRDDEGEVEYLMVVSTNTTERVLADKNRVFLENQLAEARRLKSMGAIGLGLTNEIKVPIKSIRSDVRFIQTACGQLAPLLGLAQQLAESVRSGSNSLDLANELSKTMAVVDHEFLAEEMPRAIAESLHGLENVRSIADTLSECSRDELRGTA